MKTARPLIWLATDFGGNGPYVGQMRAVLARAAPATPVVDLFNDMPAFDPRAGAYLLAAYAGVFANGDVALCVVDPGVGGPRRPVVVQADGRWFVGPDNGLLAIVARRADQLQAWELTWRPEHLSASFHGRDLFAPVAAMLARGEAPPGESLAPASIDRPDWPDDLPAVVYIDHYGNALTGLRAANIAASARLAAGGRVLERARTFADRPAGAAFWYENANGLAEIAVNQGRAATALGLAIGDAVAVTT